MATLKIYKSNISGLIKFIKSFSNSKICTNIDPKFRAIIHTKCSKMVYFIKSYAAFIIFTELCVVFCIIFEKEKLLIFGGGMVNFPPSIYYFFVAIQGFILYLEGLLNAGFDCCFASLCLSFAVYFCVVSFKFELLRKSNKTDDVKTCVEAYSELRR